MRHYLLVAATVLGVLGLAPHSSAASLKLQQPSGAPGAKVRALDTLGKARVKYYLSPSRTKAAGALSAKAKRTVKKRGRGSATVTVPAGAKEGFQYLVACARKCQAARFYVAPKPNPLNLSIDIAADATEKAKVGPSGGSISLDAGDVDYYLKVPEEAVLRETEITMTAVTGIDGLPLSGGLVGGVQFKPEGLRLLRPAELTIYVSPAPPPERRVGLSWSGEGKRMHLAPTSSTGTLTMPVTHFSGVGVAEGDQSEIEPLDRKYPPSEPSERAQQDVAAAENYEDRDRAFERWAFESVNPLLEAAAGNEADWFPALREATLWLALEDQYSSQRPNGRHLAERGSILRRVALATVGSYADTARKCSRSGDPGWWLRMYYIGRLYTLFKKAFKNPPELSGKGVDSEEIEKCVRFELDADLDFEAVATGTTGDGKTEYADFSLKLKGLEMRGDFPNFDVALDGLNLIPMKGSKKPAYGSYRQYPADPKCELEYTLKTDPMEIQSLWLELFIDAEARPRKRSRMGALGLEMGNAFVPVKERCAGQTSALFDSGWLNGQQLFYYNDRRVPVDGPEAIRNWRTPGGEPFAVSSGRREEKQDPGQKNARHSFEWELRQR